MNEQKSPIGQVRFQKKIRKYFDVDIYLTASERKKGFAKKIDTSDKMTMNESIFSDLKQKINKSKKSILVSVALAAVILLILLYL